ncbi:MAG: methyltransferase type 11, partial [Sedimenticolaceae bacterium]
VSDSPISIDNPELAKLVGDIRFFSATYRLFKLDGLEPSCEDYGQAVIYKGSLEGHPASMELDKHHLFETGRVAPVCGNTWRMLHETRFRPHFEFVGDMETHFGIFAGCGTALPFDTGAGAATPSTSCC